MNRRSVEVVASALSDGETPVEYMLKIMRDPEADEKRRDWAAEKLAPFTHARPAPMERTIQIDIPDTSTVAGIDKALDSVIAAMARGDISPSEGQSFSALIETRRRAIETGDLLARIEALERSVPGGAR